MLNYPETEQQYLSLTTQLKTILDYYRFGLSAQAVKNIYLGHGTDDIDVEICSLILGSLHLPLDWPEIYWQARLSMSEREYLLNPSGLFLRIKILCG
jgi:ribosomal protein L3 glutamine methyltransferase